MRVWIGRSILGVAVIHIGFGVVFFGGSLIHALGQRVFDSPKLLGPSATATGFWFFIAGILALMLGGMVDHLERLGTFMPGFLPWSLLGLTVIGCVLMPVSAWWLLMVPVIGMFVRQHRMASSAAQATRAVR